MIKNKKSFILIVIIILLLLLGFYLMRINNYKKIAKKYYDISINDYIGERFKFEVGNDGNYKIYLFNNGEKFYKVENFEDILNDFSKKGQINFMTDIAVIEENNHYFVPIDSYNSLINHVKSEIISVTKKNSKLEFTVKSYFCGEEDPEESSCEKENYVSTTSKFVLQKKGNNYYIDSFIFPKVNSNKDNS